MATPQPDPAARLRELESEIARLRGALEAIANHLTPNSGDHPRLLDAYMDAYFETKSTARAALATVPTGTPDRADKEGGKA